MALISRVACVVVLMVAMVLTFGTIHSGSSTYAAQLTPEGGLYHLSITDSTLTVYNINSGRNNREIYWKENAPVSPSAIQCATWTSGTDIAQNGLAFRIATQPDGGINAIVLKRNIWANVYWAFNATMFHTGAEYEEDYDGPESVDLSAYLGMPTEDIWPLRVCASIDEHDVLRFVVAKDSDPLPPLTDPGIQGGKWELDLSEYFHDDHGRTGKNGGIYAGHVPACSTLVVHTWDP